MAQQHKHECEELEHLTLNQDVRINDVLCQETSYDEKCHDEDCCQEGCVPEDDSKEIVYPKGIKWTKQRKDVYEVLLQATEPLSAVQIYNHIEKTDYSGNYAVSTIYRILTAFEEKGLVTKTNWMGDGTLVYELNKGGHTHYAVCLNCHKRIPLEACPFERMHMPHSHEKDGLDGSGFQVTGHKLELYGYCKQCQS